MSGIEGTRRCVECGGEFRASECCGCDERGLAEARLGGRHGYEPVVTTREMTRAIEGVIYRIDQIETLVREIRHALKAGAIGKWTP